MRRFIGSWLFILFLLPCATTATAQSPDAVADLAARINRERTMRGLVPYAQSTILASAAQVHASDMARTNNYSHTGSDGSTVFDRVARVGYGAYSWGRRVGENWAWYHDAATAMHMWMNSAPHRENILHPLYREMGVGIAPAAQGGFVYVVVFGAQPNVLPIFVDDGAVATQSAAVTLTLSAEDVAPAGDGPKTIGRAKQVQISDSEDWSKAVWQPFATHMKWTVPSGAGAKSVFVRFRDAQGRIAVSSDSIVLAQAGSGKAPLAAGPSVRTPTATRTRRPAPTATLRPTATRRPFQSAAAAAAASIDLPPVTLSPSPTWMPAGSKSLSSVESVAVGYRAPKDNTTTAGGTYAAASAPLAPADLTLPAAVLAATGLLVGTVAAFKYRVTRRRGR